MAQFGPIATFRLLLFVRQVWQILIYKRMNNCWKLDDHAWLTLRPVIFKECDCRYNDDHA